TGGLCRGASPRECEGRGRAQGRRPLCPPFASPGEIADSYAAELGHRHSILFCSLCAPALGRTLRGGTRFGRAQFIRKDSPLAGAVQITTRQFLSPDSDNVV